ncbi:hypothetical protein [Moraxella atlantae]|uniref:Uncharacterized protein n=1 Tax=Faucicola atlantae TaxID=34059 RepID=A0A378Q3C8_9GAMM|nr:hypothetical protein [Moraxella atlantae]OPH33610.1 hypothetical protein B5J92_09400 [Moraxella atlantae]STY95202.1 Uncharacterised protein [Moraxella atlantae]
MRLEVVHPSDIQQFPRAEAGSLRDVASWLYDELLTSGYSLLPEDVEQIALDSVRLYASWARLDAEYQKDVALPLFMSLTLDTNLLADEWAIVYPVIRAHCDLLQARRMEGSQALGVQAFGLSSSEANQIYQIALEQMKKEAFCHAPFSVEVTGEPIRTKTTVGQSQLWSFTYPMVKR